jgi:hypothetical protein
MHLIDPDSWLDWQLSANEETLSGISPDELAPSVPLLRVIDVRGSFIVALISWNNFCYSGS